MFGSIMLIPLLNVLILLMFSNYINMVKYINKVNILLTAIMAISWYEIMIKYTTIKVVFFNFMLNSFNMMNIEFMFNKLSINMTLLMLIMYTMVIYYSLNYMKTDSDKYSFIYYMNMFMFTMLLLVLSNNLIMLFLGWELVGISSYLLINFWFNKIDNIKSSMKAILYNKMGDIGLLTGMMLYFLIYNIQDYMIYFFMIALLSKSAQMLLNGWLKDAMCGPTPVSSLLHAATMVMAGIYLLYKLNMSSFSLAFLGLYTMLLAGLSGMFQYDIKKMMAYSTCSQLGYLCFSTLVNINSLNHLFNHGFFKSLLFMSSGFLIHYLFNMQDISKMSNMLNMYPIMYVFMLISSLSLIGFPFLSGFYSKDILLESSYFNYMIIYNMSLIGSVLTSLYSFSLLYMLFYNKNNLKLMINNNNNYNSDVLTYMILVNLMIASTIMGYYTSNLYSYYSIDNEYLPLNIKFLPFYFMMLSIMIMMLMSKYSNYVNIIKYYKYVNTFNKMFYFDQMYNLMLYYMYLMTSKLFFIVEKSFFDMIFLKSFVTTNNKLNNLTILKTNNNKKNYTILYGTLYSMMMTIMIIMYS